MPFKGSQQLNSISIAYWLNNHINTVRIILLALCFCLSIIVFNKLTRVQQAVLFTGLGLYLIVFYLFNFKFLADKMFLQPSVTLLASGKENIIKNDKLVLGVEVNGEARAYPIQIIGYHHQIKDAIKGTKILVTYCTVCRTGRVFDPTVRGKIEDFRLVGMDHYNAMFEDYSTKSWWRQANGEAIAGPLKGEKLRELPSRQMTLASWLALYPNSLVLQQIGRAHV